MAIDLERILRERKYDAQNGRGIVGKNPYIGKESNGGSASAVGNAQGGNVPSVKRPEPSDEVKNAVHKSLARISGIPMTGRDDVGIVPYSGNGGKSQGAVSLAPTRKNEFMLANMQKNYVSPEVKNAVEKSFERMGAVKAPTSPYSPYKTGSLDNQIKYAEQEYKLAKNKVTNNQKDYKEAIDRADENLENLKNMRYNIDIKNKRAEMEKVVNNEDFERYSADPGGKKEISFFRYIDPRYNAINQPIAYADEKERKIYFYYLEKEGQKKADEYYKTIERELTARRAEQKSKEDEKFGNEHKILASAETIAASIPALKDYYSEVRKYNKNKKNGTYEPMNADSMNFDTTRKQMDLEQGITKDMSGAGKFFTQTGLSIGKSLASSLFGKFGLLIMSGNAAAQSTFEALKNGATSRQALTKGLADGFTEYITEKVPFDNFFKIVKGGNIKGAKALLKNILKQAGAEGSGEALAEYMNYAIDRYVMGDKSDFNSLVNTYIENGYTSKEAEKEAGKQYLIVNPALAFAGGAISGVGMGGVAQTTNYLAGKWQNHIEGKTAENKNAPSQQTENVQALSSNARNASVENGTVNSVSHNNENVNNSNIQHVYDIKKADKDFINATDSKFVEFIKQVEKNPNDSKSKYIFGKTTNKLNTALKKLLNIDTADYKHYIKANSIRHIINNHGINGKTDTSMADITDIAKIGYVIDNFETINVLEENSKEYRDRNQRPAPMIRLSKRVDGTFYVVEAVPETNAKSLAIVSAYIQKADVGSRVKNVQGNSLDMSASSDVGVIFEPPAQKGISENINNTEPMQSVLKSGQIENDIDIDGEGIGNNQTEAEKLAGARLERILKNRFGVETVHFNDENGSKGYYDPKTKKIYTNDFYTVNRYATTAHEFFHSYKDIDVEGYNVIKKAVLADLSLEEYNKYKERQINLRNSNNLDTENIDIDDLVAEEVISDLGAEVLKNPESLERIFKRFENDKSFIEKFMDYIRGLVRKVREFLNSDYIENDNDIRNLVKNYSEIENIYRSVLESGGTMDYSAEGNDTGVKYSITDANDTEKIGVKQQIKNNSETLGKMEPVYNNNLEVEKKGRMENQEWVMNLFKNYNYEVFREGLGKIIIDRRRIRSSLSYLKTDGDLAAYAALPAVLENGKIIGEHPDHKSRRYKTVTIGAPVVINGVRGNMAAVIRLDGENNYYKVHRILMPDGSSFVYENKISNAETAEWPQNNETTLSPADVAYDDIVSQNDEDVNINKISNAETAEADLQNKPVVSPTDVAYNDSVSQNDEDVKYKLPTAEEKQDAISRADVEAVQSIPRKSVNDFTSDDIKKTENFARKYFKEMGTKSPFFRSWFGDWRANDNTEVKIANQKGAVRGTTKNNDTGWDIQISGKVFSESRHSAVKNKTAFPYLDYINSIVENAVLLDSYTIPGEKAKSDNSAMMHTLYAISDMGKGNELIKLYVEELNDVNNDGTIKRAYQLQNITKQQLNVRSSENTRSSIISTADVYTVSHLFDIVKLFDKNFNPKGASKVVNEDGTPKVVYHGTDSDFTVFDITKSRSYDGTLNYDLPGFYFSENTDEAGSYGNFKEYYLDLKNPYKGDIVALAREKGSYRNAYDYLVSQGYDGMIVDDMGEGFAEYIVFNSNQIKSATDNIGTFDRGNDDIRYKLPTAEEKQDEEMRKEAKMRMNEMAKEAKQATDEGLDIEKYYNTPREKRITENAVRAPRLERMEKAAEDFKKTGDSFKLPKKSDYNSYKRDAQRKGIYYNNIETYMKNQLSGVRSESEREVIKKALDMFLQKKVAYENGEKERAQKVITSMDEAYKMLDTKRNFKLAEEVIDDIIKNTSHRYISKDTARNGYYYRTHTFYQIMLEAFGEKHYGIVKDLIDDFNDSKGNMSKRIDEKLVSMHKAVVNDLGIKKGSRESAAVMWYGEGEKTPDLTNADDIALLKKMGIKDFKKLDPNIKVKYDGARLEKDFGHEKAERIKKADAYFRKVYDEYIDDLNAQRKRIYPFNPQKQIQKRKNYYRHFEKMTNDFPSFVRSFRNDTEMDAKYRPGQDYSAPNSKKQSIEKRRKGKATAEDAVGGFIDYVTQAEYILNIDDNISAIRSLASDIIDLTKDKGGAEEFTQYLLDFANHLAGKSTSDIEKGLKKLFSKKANKVLQTLNNTKKANSVIGNISTILKQPTNVINGLGVLENPIMIFKGIKDTVVGVTNENIKRRYKESNFLTERFLDKSYSVFEKNSPLKFFSDMLGWADEFGARSVWNAAYDDALKLKKTGKKSDINPARYADDAARAAVAGRGIGEVPLIYKSEIAKLALPFQIEVQNGLHLMYNTLTGKYTSGEYMHKSKVSKRIGKELAMLFAMWAANGAIQAITGSKASLDIIGDIIDGMKQGFKEKDDEDFLDKLLRGTKRSTQNVAGDFASNALFGWVVGEILELFNEDYSDELFNGNFQSNGVNIPAGQSFGKAIKKAVQRDFAGAGAEAVTSFVTPYGGAQIDKTIRGLTDWGKGAKYQNDAYKKVSKFFANRNSSDYEGVDGKKKYDIEKNPLTFAQSALFGPSALGGDYYNDQKTARHIKDEEKAQRAKREEKFRKNYKNESVIYLAKAQKDNDLIPYDEVKSDFKFTHKKQEYEFTIPKEAKEEYDKMLLDEMEKEYDKVMDKPEYRGALNARKAEILKDAKSKARKTVNAKIKKDYLDGKFGD